MKASELNAWLDRREAPPPALRARLREVADDSSEPLPVHLARLGQALLARVTAAPGGRELALDLLAADAFVTYAFEAQAEADVAGLAPLATHIARDGARHER